MIVNKNFIVVQINKQLQKNKRSLLVNQSKGYFGVKCIPNEKGKGVIINHVAPNSPAFKHSFKEGDIILAINNANISSFEMLVETISSFAPNTQVEVLYKSSFLAPDAEPLTKKVTLGELEFKMFKPDQDHDMSGNLQFGYVVSIGKKCPEFFPEIKLGQIALFHHSVEYKKVNSDVNYNDWHLLEENDDFEYRLVHIEREFFGVVDNNSKDKFKIIPHPDFIFCHPIIKKSSCQIVDGIWQFDNWGAREEELQQKLEELKNQVDELNTNSVMRQADNDRNYKEKEVTKKIIDDIDRERRALTIKMHQKKLIDVKVAFINKKSSEQLNVNIKQGYTLTCDYNTLYPLDFLGVNYVLARIDHIYFFTK